MSDEQSTVTYSVAEILTRLEKKIDSLQQDVTDLKVGQARLEEESKSMREDVKELKGSSKAQIWTLIGILITAVSGFLVAVGRFVFFGKP
jgi:uncharacterized protein (UPF0335 family)